MTDTCRNKTMERERERDRATEERLFYLCHDLFIFDGHNKIICQIWGREGKVPGFYRRANLLAYVKNFFMVEVNMKYNKYSTQQIRLWQYNI